MAKSVLPLLLIGGGVAAIAISMKKEAPKAAVLPPVPPPMPRTQQILAKAAPQDETPIAPFEDPRKVRAMAKAERAKGNHAKAAFYDSKADALNVAIRKAKSVRNSAKNKLTKGINKLFG